MKAWLYETHREKEGRSIEIEAVNDVVDLFNDDRHDPSIKDKEIVIGIPDDNFYKWYNVPPDVKVYIEIYNGFRE